MRAVGFFKSLPIDHPESLLDVDLPVPTATGHDLLVKVKAVSVNPVDVKQRAAGNQSEKEPRVLGWDATGVVEKTGDEVTLFQSGDEVWYAGSIARPGCDCEYHLVEESIVGKKPRALSFAEAAALPLTSITAWESLFDRCGIGAASNESKSVLIIGGAGGVGSIAIQIAKKVANLTVIATASRPDSAEWCRQMGADYVINHHSPLRDALQQISIGGVEYVLCCNSIEMYVQQLADIIKPQGKICSIIRAKEDQPLQINPLMYKSVGFMWELMFTRPMFQTSDRIAQHHLLNRVSELVDEGVIRTTMREDFGALNAANLRKAHAKIESGGTIGKLVLTL